MQAILEPGKINPGHAILRLINNTDQVQYVDTRTALFEHEFNTAVLRGTPALKPHADIPTTWPKTPLLKLQPGGQTVGIIPFERWFNLTGITSWTGRYEGRHPLAGDMNHLTPVVSNEITISL